MRVRYNLMGKHVDDDTPLVIGTFDTRKQVDEAIVIAISQDKNNQWKFFAEPTRRMPSFRDQLRKLRVSLKKR